MYLRDMFALKPSRDYSLLSVDLLRFTLTVDRIFLRYMARFQGQK